VGGQGFVQQAETAVHIANGHHGGTFGSGARRQGLGRVGAAAAIRGESRPRPGPAGRGLALARRAGR
jgi:hypothetical protein